MSSPSPLLPTRSTLKAITAFDFNGLTPAVIGVVNETAKTVTLTVPFGTVVTALVPTITITGALVSPASGVAHDFTSPVTYTVAAADASTQAYLVFVVFAPNPSILKAITAFNFNALTPAVIGVVNETLHTIALTVPFGTVVTALVPTITITGALVSPASGVAHDFTNPATYTVAAADASTQAYVVTVTIAPNPVSKSITAFNFNGLTPAVIGVVNETTKTVTLTVPFGTVGHGSRADHHHHRSISHSGLGAACQLQQSGRLHSDGRRRIDPGLHRHRHGCSQPRLQVHHRLQLQRADARGHRSNQRD